MKFFLLVVFAALVADTFAQTPYPWSPVKSGVTTRYWDCCKPSCAWQSNVPSNATAAKACYQDGVSKADPNSQNVCGGGGSTPISYTCTNNAPFVQNNIAYGFAAVNTATPACCACYKLTFTSAPVTGQVMYVQATNVGTDVSSNQFDLNIPGGGTGIYNGCVNQFGSWNGGAQYGGVSSSAQCANLPAALRGDVNSGCNFRFGWFKGADNPTVSYQQVHCPSQLTSISGCNPYP